MDSLHRFEFVIERISPVPVNNDLQAKSDRPVPQHRAWLCPLSYREQPDPSHMVKPGG